MKHPAESVASLELVWRVRSGETEARRPWYRWCQPESAMWPMGVVVVNVDAQDALELPAAGDEELVEAVAADGADPAFGERVGLRRPKWGADDLDAVASEDLVEDTAELAVSVVNQTAEQALRGFKTTARLENDAFSGVNQSFETLQATDKQRVRSP